MTTRRTPRAARPRVEGLEDRANPADFHASTYAAFQSAVAQANLNGEDDRIFLDADVRKVPSQEGGMGGLAVGEPGHALDIIGTTSLTKIDAGFQGRLFTVTDKAVTFTNLTLANGRVLLLNGTEAKGGAILVGPNAAVTVTNVLFTGNVAQGTTFVASNDDLYDPAKVGAAGGAIYNRGALTVVSSVFDGNTAVGANASGLPRNTTGQLVPGGTGYVGGEALGGAIANDPATATATITGSVFVNNTAQGGQGGKGGDGNVTNPPTVPAGPGGPGGRAAGGAIAGAFRVYTSLFGPTNQALGGAGGLGGTGDGFASSFNLAQDGGPGGAGGDALGGAVYASGTDATAVLGNSTVSGNGATPGGGGTGGSPGGSGANGPAGSAGALAVGGVAVAAGAPLTLASTTVAANAGTGVYLSSGASLALFNSLLADHATDLGSPGAVSVVASGSLVEAPAAVVALLRPMNPSGGPGGKANVTARDPGLGALAANGADAVLPGYPLQTHAIGSASAAANIGDAAGSPTYLTTPLVGDPAHDGTGKSPRVAGPATDAGAFEAAATGTQSDVQVAIVTTGGNKIVVTNNSSNDLPAARVRAVPNGAIAVNGQVPGVTFDVTVAIPAGQSVMYPFATSPTADGTLSVTADPGAGASDPDLSNNAAAATFYAPLGATLARAAGESDPAAADTARFDLAFTFPVAAFSPNLLTVTATDADGAPLPRPAVTVSPGSGSATHFTVTIVQPKGGTVTVSLAAGVIARADAAGVTNAAAGPAAATFVLRPVVVALVAVGHDLGVPFKVVNPDGSPATDFVGDVAVQFVNAVGDVEDKTVSFSAADRGVRTATFRYVPGPAMFRATVQGRTTAVNLTVAPAADPNPVPLRDPQVRGQAINANVLAAGVYVNTDKQFGGEPVTVSNLLGESSLSVLHVSPDHVRNYPQPTKTIDRSGTTAATVARLDAAGPGGDLPDDVAVAYADGHVAVAVTTQTRVDNAGLKPIYPYEPNFPPLSDDPVTRENQLATRRRHAGTYSPPQPAPNPTDLPPPAPTYYNGFSVTSIAVGGTPTAVVAGQFRFPGTNDLAVANPGGRAVQLIKNDSGGVFALAAADPLDGVNATALAVGKIFGGPLDDLAIVDGTFNTVRLLRNMGGGAFDPVQTPATTLPVSFGTITKVAIADFDDDGQLDVAVGTSAGKVGIFYGSATGQFSQAQVYDAVFAGAVDLLAVDVNRDGRPDLVAVSPNDAGVALLVQAGDKLKAFYGVRKVALPPLVVDAASGLPGRVDRTGVALAAGSFDGDAVTDIAVLDNLGEVLTLSGK